MREVFFRCSVLQIWHLGDANESWRPNLRCTGLTMLRSDFSEYPSTLPRTGMVRWFLLVGRNAVRPRRNFFKPRSSMWASRELQSVVRTWGALGCHQRPLSKEAFQSDIRQPQRNECLLTAIRNRIVGQRHDTSTRPQANWSRQTRRQHHLSTRKAKSTL